MLVATDARRRSANLSCEIDVFFTTKRSGGQEEEEEEKKGGKVEACNPPRWPGPSNQHTRIRSLDAGLDCRVVYVIFFHRGGGV